MQDGFSGVLDLLSPFNVVNLVVTFLTIAPGLLLLWASDKIARRPNSPPT